MFFVFGMIGSMSAKDWTKLYKKYKGLWVALAKDEVTVLAAHKTARGAFSEAKERVYKYPILTRVPEDLKAYAGLL